MAVKNIPVEYLCRYPFPAKYTTTANDDDGKLKKSFLSRFIDEYGVENVMLLAQSTWNEKCPIQVHVNELMKENNTHGKRRYNSANHPFITSNRKQKKIKQSIACLKKPTPLGNRSNFYDLTAGSGEKKILICQTPNQLCH